MHHAGTHILTLCSRDVCRSTQAWSMHTNCFQEKQTIDTSQSSEAQIMCTCPGGGAVKNRRQKGPKGPEAQPEGLLAFLLQGEKEQEKKGREVSRFSPTARNPKKMPANPQGTWRRGRGPPNNGSSQSPASRILTSCICWPLLFSLEHPGLATQIKGHSLPGDSSHPFPLSKVACIQGWGHQCYKTSFVTKATPTG